MEDKQQTKQEETQTIIEQAPPNPPNPTEQIKIGEVFISSAFNQPEILWKLMKEILKDKLVKEYLFEIEKKIVNTFSEFRKELVSKVSKEDIKEFVSRKEIDLMIRETINNQLHTQLHSVTAHTTARNKLKTSEKKVLKRLDSIKLMKAIQFCISQRYSTSTTRDDIINRFDIGERCFYNHLKKVREQLHITASAVKIENGKR